MDRFSPFIPNARTPDRWDAYRSEDPVHWGHPAHTGHEGSWYIFTHAEALAFLRHPHAVRDVASVVPPEVLAAQRDPRAAPIYEVLDRWMLLRDPPTHTRLRRLVAPAFTPKALGKWNERIRTLAEQQVASLDPAGFDVVADLALPFPVAVIGQLLGAPAEAAPRLRTWSEHLGRAFDLAPDMSHKAQGARAVVEFAAWFRAHLSERTSSDALFDVLREAHDGDRLDDAELVATAMLLLFAGHETTVHLIAAAVRLLLNTPDGWADLVLHPERAPNIIEETLRLDGPVQYLGRWVSDDLPLGERTLRRGQMGLVVVGAANRDPARYPEPHRFDPSRGATDHMGMGFGLHYCLGAPLGRAEAAAALVALAHRFPALAPAGEAVEGEGVLLSGLARLPVRATEIPR